jgi:phosphatidylserine/phosphatidylglycerophosphate/cardiolipin synthase-like enzyme
LIQLRTLTDGGQSAREIALLVASFLERSKRTLDLALYDLKLDDEPEEIVRAALVGAHERGVRVRLLYNLEPTLEDRVPVPPPPKTDPPLVEELPFATAGVPGHPDLMHHKFVIRDGVTVLTGSTNWTDDSWTREENVIAVVDSRSVAIRFEQDFGQLWNSREVEKSGRVASAPVRVGQTNVRTWFAPKRGEKLSHRIAHAIARAERRVRIASPVITSGPVLGTVAEVVGDARVDLAGVVDNTQVNEVLRQWAQRPNRTWKAPALRAALAGRFSGKRSTPYAPDSVHDFMHAKVTVCDDTAFVGSFNLSHSGEQNAENVLEFDDAQLAERLAGFVDDIRARYSPVELDM